MISSLDVGATFRIVDAASVPLKEIAAQLNAIQAAIDRVKGGLVELAESKFPGLTRSLGTLVQRMDALGVSAQKGADGVASAFTALDTAVGTSISRVQALKAELASIHGPAAVALPGAGGGRGGVYARGGHGGGGGFGGASIPVSPAGTRYHIPGGPLLAGAAAAGYGVFEEMQLRDSIYKMLRTSSQPMGPMEQNQYYSTIRQAILGAYVETGLPVKDIEKGYVEGIQTLAPLPLAQRLKQLGVILPHAATDAFLKDIPIAEAVKSMAQLAHMGGAYTLEKADKLMGTFAYLSAISPEKMPQITRAASYAIPILRTSGYDPEQLLYMITSMQRAGIVNTKSGTWLDRMFEMANPGTSVLSRKSFSTHEAALRELGLVDASGRQTFLGANGRPDAFKFIQLLHGHATGLEVNERNRVFKQLFGQQGERAAAFFSDQINDEMLRKAMLGEKDFVSGHKFWEDAGKNNPMTEARKTLADFNKALIDLGSTILPPLTFAINQLDAGLKDLTGYFSGLSALASLWGAGTSSIGMPSDGGAGLWGKITGGASSAWQGIKSWFGGGASSGSVPAFPNSSMNFFEQRGGSGLDYTGMNSTFTSRLQAALTAAEKATGQPARITSMHRSSALQAWLYARYRAGLGGLAAPPGHSQHEIGDAADLAAGADLDWLHSHAGDFGLEFLPGHAGAVDPGHIQLNDRVLSQPSDQPGAVHHVTVNIDGRKVATAVQRSIVDSNTQVRGPSNFDGRSIPTPVDSGLQYNF